MENLTLSKCKPFKVYKIKEILVSDVAVKNQLKNLGIAERQNIEVVASNYGKKSYLVRIHNMTYAIDKQICDEVVCYE